MKARWNADGLIVVELIDRMLEEIELCYIWCDCSPPNCPCGYDALQTWYGITLIYGNHSANYAYIPKLKWKTIK